MDILFSKQNCTTVRCEAAQALLDMLLHPSISWKFMMTDIEGHKYTPYEQVTHLFMKHEVSFVILLKIFFVFNRAVEFEASFFNKFW